MHKKRYKKPLRIISADELNELQRHLGIDFKDTNLLVQALTHKSFSHENEEHPKHNERLEFLGDSVLGLVINDYLYNSYPDLREGDLAKIKSVLVSEATLSSISKSLKLGEHIQLGKGEQLSGGRERKALLEDVFEALVGAVYLDQGIDRARKFILKVFYGKFEMIKEEGFFVDYKTIFQEKVQKKKRTTPNYEIVKEEGPNHNRIFYVNAVVDGEVYGQGSGKTKKEAEQNAAHKAISSFPI